MDIIIGVETLIDRQTLKDPIISTETRYWWLRHKV